MELRGEIVGYEGDILTLKAYDTLDSKTLANSLYNGKYWAIVDTYENEKITPDQRKHIYALLNDYVEYTGVPLDATEAHFKYQFMIEQGMDELPSFKRNAISLSMAGEFISYLIDYYIQNDIPFRKQQFYLTTDTSKMLYALTMKRICWVCGKQRSELAHYEAVGLGRDRNKIDHTKHHFMMLCGDCHATQHQIGIETFMRKHHIKPIKLKDIDLKQLGIRGNYEA